MSQWPSRYTVWPPTWHPLYIATLASLIVLIFVSSAARAEVIAIRAGYVIDPETATARPNEIILIENERIKEIGRAVSIPQDTTVVDLSNRTALPGLIDAHTHLLAAIDPKWDLGDTWLMTLQRREGYRAILGARHAKEVLEAGFTTVRDVGNSGEYLDMDLEKAIRFGAVPGPTIKQLGNAHRPARSRLQPPLKERVRPVKRSAFLSHERRPEPPGSSS